MKPKSDSLIYNQKGRDSFKTRLNLYLFNQALKGVIPDKIDREDFKNFNASKELIITYTTEYWQLEKEDSIGEIQIAKIEGEITRWKKVNKNEIDSLQLVYLKEIFKSIFPFDDFLKLIKPSNRECYYCHITEAIIDDLIDNQLIFKKRFRGFTLEIDRKKPNEEYTKDNSVLCCYWCNNAKTDEFCDGEFMDVGIEIGKIWQKRLLKKHKK